MADAYLLPILLQVLERLKASPYLAKCAKDGRTIYIASELLRTAAWYFDSHVGLGRNTLYAALRRHGLLAAHSTVSIFLADEFGNRVKKRALAFLIDRLSDFVEFDVSAICHASAELETEGEEQEAGGHA